jgi:hypothetical protein
VPENSTLKQWHRKQLSGEEISASRDFFRAKKLSGEEYS